MDADEDDWIDEDDKENKNRFEKIIFINPIICICVPFWKLLFFTIIFTAMQEEQITTEQQPTPEHHASPPLDFVNPKTNIRYRYDFENLVVEQCEFAEEVLAWKREQMKSPPQAFHDISRSRGAEWLSIVASYLLVKVVDGEAQAFSLATIAETEQFVKSLPAKEMVRLREVLTDFFTVTGKRGAILALLQNRGGISAETIISELLMNSLKPNASPAPVAKKSSKTR